MGNATILVAIAGSSKRTWARLLIPLDQLYLVEETETWPLNNILLLASLWNDGKSSEEIAKELDPPPGTPLYKPGQVVTKANNLLLILGIRERYSYPSISKPKPDKNPERKIRKCLKCREKFTSHWFGERVCKTCKLTDAWASGGDCQTYTSLDDIQ